MKTFLIGFIWLSLDLSSIKPIDSNFMLLSSFYFCWQILLQGKIFLPKITLNIFIDKSCPPTFFPFFHFNFCIFFLQRKFYNFLQLKNLIIGMQKGKLFFIPNSFFSSDFWNQKINPILSPFCWKEFGWLCPQMPIS